MAGCTRTTIDSSSSRSAIANNLITKPISWAALTSLAETLEIPSQ